MKFWQGEIEKGESCIFPTLHDFLNESHSKMNETDFKKDINVHLAGLKESFEKCYPKKFEKAKEDWIRDPFLARELPAHFDHREKEELIDMVTDTSLQDSFIKEELADFWLQRFIIGSSIKVYNAIRHFLYL